MELEVEWVAGKFAKDGSLGGHIHVNAKDRANSSTQLTNSREQLRAVAWR